MKKILHYIFIISTIILMAICVIPAIFFWLVTDYNLIHEIYWAAGSFERKYFGK